MPDRCRKQRDSCCGLDGNVVHQAVLPRCASILMAVVIFALLPLSFLRDNGSELVQRKLKHEESGILVEDNLCFQPPYAVLGLPSDTSMAVNLMSDQSPVVRLTAKAIRADDTSEVKVDFATPSFQMSAKLPYTVNLQELEPSTRYKYSVNYKNRPNCPEQIIELGYFHTQRLPGEEFTFAVTADTHMKDEGAFYSEVFEKTISNMEETAHSQQGLDFLIDLGDTFMGEKIHLRKEDDHLLYEDNFKGFSPVASSAPLFLVNGNHDGEHGYLLESSADKEESDAVHFAQMRNKYFLNPKPGDFYSGNLDIEFPWLGQVGGNYYSWSWGDALFVTLDPYWYTREKTKETAWSWTLGEKQYNWLYSVLTDSPAKFKFVFIHQYVGGVFGTTRGYGGNGDETFAKYFEWGGKNEEGVDEFEIRRPGWQHGPIHSMLVEHGVSVVFRGHDHLYHEGILDGIVYNTLPKTSLPPHVTHYDEIEEKGYKDGEVDITSGHTEVHINGNDTVVSLIEFDSNSVIHQFTVSAKVSAFSNDFKAASSSAVLLFNPENGTTNVASENDPAIPPDDTTESKGINMNPISSQGIENTEQREKQDWFPRLP